MSAPPDQPRRRAARPRGLGLGVDASGGPVIDPTANVIALTEAEAKRQDDLRTETGRRIDTELSCVRDIGNLRADHVKELGEMRAAHAREMAVAESKRLDAVRAVDVLAVNTAAERSQQSIQALATVTTTNAENLRNAMAATAAAIAQQTATTVGLINERIAALEKASYEGMGKSKVADPAMEHLLLEVKALRIAGASREGKGEGVGAILGYAIALAAVLIAGLAVYLK